MSFLPQRPRSANYTFVKPRDNTTSESGLPATRFSASGFMRGSMRFKIQRDTRELFAALQTADRPGSTGFFLAELEVPYRDEADERPSSPLPTPIWHVALPTSTPQVLVGTPGSLPRAGAVFSIRSSNTSVRDYVTARIAVAVDGTNITLNHPLPLEFFSLTNNLEYCYNRPHVRAIFIDDTAQWSMDFNNLATVSTVRWIEDAGATIFALKGAANLPFPPGGASEGSGGKLLLEDGGAFLLEDGGHLLLET